MNNMKYKIYLIFLLFCTGCVHRQSSFEHYQTTIHLSQDYSLQLKSGTITPIDTLNRSITYKVRFDEVRGGDSKLFEYGPLPKVMGTRLRDY